MEVRIKSKLTQKSNQMNNTLSENQVEDSLVAYERRQLLRALRDQARIEYFKSRELLQRATEIYSEARAGEASSLDLWQFAFAAVEDAEANCQSSMDLWQTAYAAVEEV